MKEKVEQNLEYYMWMFLENRVKPYIQDSTYRSYIQSLIPNFFNNPIASLMPSELSANVLEQYYLDLLGQKSRQTTEIMVTLTKRLSAYLFSERITEENYADKVMLPRQTKGEMDFVMIRKERDRKRFFTDEDIRKIYKAYRGGGPGLRKNEAEWLPVILLQLETFLRGSEVISIFLENINFDRRLLWVRNTVGKRFRDNHAGNSYEKYLKVPKNGEERIVPLSALACDLIREMLLSAMKNPHGLLFPQRNGRMRTLENYEKCFRRICDHLEIDRDCRKTDCCGRVYGLNTHALRHTGITMANAAEGANACNTALMAGHSVRRAGGCDLGSDAVYTHAVIEELRKVKTPSMILGLYDGNPSADGFHFSNKILFKQNYIPTDTEKQYYKVSLHTSRGYRYASTQLKLYNPRTGKGEYRHIHWGKVDENNRFYPNERFYLASSGEREKLLFPKEWDISLTKEEDPFAGVYQRLY